MSYLYLGLKQEFEPQLCNIVFGICQYMSLLHVCVPI